MLKHFKDVFKVSRMNYDRTINQSNDFCFSWRTSSNSLTALSFVPAISQMKAVKVVMKVVAMETGETTGTGPMVIKCVL